MRAHANYLRMGIALVAAALLYVGAVVVQPYLKAYQLSQTVKLACYDIIRTSRGGNISLEALPEKFWLPEFESRVRRAGLPEPEPDDYEFELSIEGDKVACHGTLYIHLTTRWMVLDDFVDIKPIETDHEVTFTHAVARKL